MHCAIASLHCYIAAAGQETVLRYYSNTSSKVKLFMVDDQYELAKLVKSTIYGKKIVVGMGAGTISSWMKELPSLI